MKKLLCLLTAATVGALALPAASTPAGACSIICLGELEELSEPEVILLEGDPSAELPDWSGDAMIEASMDGTVFLLMVDEETFYPQQPEEVE